MSSTTRTGLTAAVWGRISSGDIPESSWDRKASLWLWTVLQASLLGCCAEAIGREFASTIKTSGTVNEKNTYL